MTAVIEAVTVDLDALAPADIDALTTWGEAERAARYRGPHAAARFLARRAAMRLIVARRLDRRPQDVVLSDDRHGRPLVGSDRIHISQASRGRVMLAVTCIEQEVGCDIEEMRDDIDVEAVAKLSFGATERNTLQAIMPEGRLQAFYDCWTRKEAFLKAVGTGMTVAMDSFETWHRFGVATRDGQVDWTSFGWTPQPGFAAAVVTRGTDWTIVHRAWPASSDIAIAA